MATQTRVRAAVFPGAANAPLYLAEQRSWFAEAGLSIDVTEVVSSDQQMALWDSGRCDVMHTAADHLLRERERDPVIVRRDGFGELSVYKQADAHQLSAIEWGVDSRDSGFAFVMRAVLEDQCGLSAAEQRLEPIGGTKQRFEALVGGSSQGTTLHPPFDVMADAAGLVRLSGHLETMPQLLAVVTVVVRSAAGSGSIAAYLEVLDRANAALVDDSGAIAAVLQARGLAAPVAAAAASGLSGAGGLSAQRQPTVEGLEAVANLRERFDRHWSRPSRLEQLLVEWAD